MLLHGLGRFRQAAVRIGPTTDQKHPMLDEHRQELGIHFTQDTPRLRTAGLVDSPMTLPQFKQQFDLPPHTSQDQRLAERQAVRGDMGHQDGPGGQCQSHSAHLTTFFLGGCTEPPASGRGHVLRHALGEQARWHALLPTQSHLLLDSVRRGRFEERQQLPPVARGVVHDRLQLES